MTKLDKIRKRLANLLVECGAVKTDKAVLVWDSEEDLKAGYSVYVDVDGERKPAEDGEYATEDGKTIVVKDGKVESIVDAAAEVDAAEKTKCAETDKQACAEDAEPMVENPDGSKEDVNKAIEELRKEVNELYKIVDAVLNKIGESRKEADERLSKIEKMSAAKPAEDEIKKTVTVETAGDKKLEMFRQHFK
jgi:hypothetical protein